MYSMNKNLLYLFFIFLLTASSCNTYKKSYVADDVSLLSAKLPEQNLKETIFLIGNTGASSSANQSLLFNFLQKDLNQADENSSLIFLGDNIKPNGLPKKKNKKYKKAIEVIDNQLNLLNNFKGESYFIPGDKDWNNAREDGFKYVKRQEDYIQKVFKDSSNIVKFYPNNACGDIEVKKAADDLYYIFIDSQWWLQNWALDKKINKGCKVKSRQEFLVELESAIWEHKNDQIIIFMHHPLYSNGERGGHFSLKTHLFPLTDVNSKLWIPLPVLGSILPVQRSLGSNDQDISNELYQELKNEILLMTGTLKNIIFASAHEGNLQYFNENFHHYIISGGGSDIDYARQGGDAKFVRSVNGYSKLYVYENGEVWLDFIQVDKDKPTGEILYRKQIIEAKPGTEIIEKEYPKAADLPDSVLVAVDPKLKSSKFKMAFMGKQYRYAWTTPIKAPVVNFETEKGGIFPVKKGGGQASNSLRVENANGEQFALRSIKKIFSSLDGTDFENMVVVRHVLEDMGSATHPFGPLVLPKMSEAINIYHTNPKVVFLKKQEGLGAFNPYFNEELYLLEDRPAKNREHDANLGNSKDIISYVDIIALKTEKNDIKIDQEWALRSRLFDVFIHDWDRHDDQWRWALIEENGEEIYRPIPRDRDQVFYKFQGVLPWFVSVYYMKKFKSFKKNLKDVKHQSYNAMHFDRYFLNELEWQDWEKQVAILKENLTDEVIDEAFEAMPPEIPDAENEQMAATLKSRRGHMDKIAWKLYKYISKNVSIPGSNEREYFKVERLKNGDVAVQMYSMSKKGKKKDLLYERTFQKGITKEIRLYGLGGKDEFEIEGESMRSIKVRVVGGFGKDKFDDDSKVFGLKKMTKVYDEVDGIKIKSAAETRKIINNDVVTNEYEREDHQYNQTLYAPIIKFTKDDRLWLGLSSRTITHGFRKDPYKSIHQVSASISPSSKTAFNLIYNGDYNKILFNKLDVNFNVALQNPFYVNYFGLGNNVNTDLESTEFNWVRMRSYYTHLYLNKSWWSKKYNLYFGPKFSSWSVKNVEGRVLDHPDYALPVKALERKNYLGAELGFKVDNSDSKIFPKKGVKGIVSGSSLKNISAKETMYFLQAEQIFYLTFGSKFSTTLASRTGWRFSGGDLNFYNYVALGNSSYLRAYRNESFRGNHIFYQNTDLRIKLYNWKNKILPFEIGIDGAYDVGRAWLKTEGKEGSFHHSYSAGVWFNVLSSVVIHPTVSFAKDERQFNFNLGFNF